MSNYIPQPEQLRWANPFIMKFCSRCATALPLGEHRAYCDPKKQYYCKSCARDFGLVGDDDFLRDVVEPSYRQQAEDSSKETYGMRNQHNDAINNLAHSIRCLAAAILGVRYEYDSNSDNHHTHQRNNE